MILSLKKIGSILRDKGKKSELDILLDKDKVKEVEKVLVVNFSRKGTGSLNFNKVYIEDFDSKHSEKYLYKRGSSRGTDLTPTSRVTALDKTFNIKFVSWFEKYDGNNKKILLLKEEIEQKKEQIRKRLEEKYETLSPEDRDDLLLSLSVTESGKTSYLKSITGFRDWLKKRVRDKLANKYGVESQGKGRCSACKERKKVFGFSLPYKFYTYDKRLVAYNLKPKNAWRQLPVCYDCYLDIRAGRSFVEKYLNFSTGNQNYYVIPDSFKKETLENIIEEVLTFRQTEAYQKGDYRALVGDEEDFSRLVKSKKDTLNINYLFYVERQSSRSQIEAFISGVSPSWIKTIYNAMQEVTAPGSLFTESRLKTILGKDWKGDLNYNFNTIKEFFPYSKTKGNYEKYYLNIISDILNKDSIKESFLVSRYIDELRDSFRNFDQKGGVKKLCLDSLMFTTFLSKINLLRFKRSSSKNLKEISYPNSTMDKTKKQRLEDFFSEFEGAFAGSASKGVFALGVYVGFLLALQHQIKGDAPFRNTLHDLRLDERKVRALLPKAKNKLDEYASLSEMPINYSWLEETISIYFVQSQEDWNLSKDQVSYYFTLGLGLSKLFKGQSSES